MIIDSCLYFFCLVLLFYSAKELCKIVITEMVVKGCLSNYMVLGCLLSSLYYPMISTMKRWLGLDVHKKIKFLLTTCYLNQKHQRFLTV